jgi:hypothetical protein
MNKYIHLCNHHHNLVVQNPAVLGFELSAYILRYSTSHFFCIGFFNMVSQTICPVCLQTSILLISAS